MPTAFIPKVYLAAFLDGCGLLFSGEFVTSAKVAAL